MLASRTRSSSAPRSLNSISQSAPQATRGRRSANSRSGNLPRESNSLRDLEAEEHVEIGIFIIFI